MAGPMPTAIAVTAAQVAVLTTLQRRASCPQALALRVQIILGAAAGQRNDPLARQLGCQARTVALWRGRRAAALARLAAVDAAPATLARVIAAVLADAPRPGTRATFSAEQIVQIINLACRPPEQLARPIAAWTPRELADEAINQGLVTSISPRSVERFLKGRRAATAPEPLLAQRQGQTGRS